MTLVKVAALLRGQADALEAQASSLTVQARTLRAQADGIEADVAATTTPRVTPALLDKRGVAEALSVSMASVDRLDREGQPHVRIGDNKRYDLVDVLAWHTRRSSQSAAPASGPQGASILATATGDGARSGVRLLSKSRRAGR